MSFKDCITEAVFRKLLSQGKAQEALGMFDDLKEELRAQGFSEAQAEAKAAADTQKYMEEGKAAKKKQAIAQINRQKAIKQNFLGYKNLKGEEDFGRAMLAHFEGDQTSTFENYYTRKETTLGRLHSYFLPLLEKYKPNAIGIRSLADLDDVVRELFGQDSKNATAKAMSKAWKETSEFARKMANLAGASIPKLENWGLPQTHDQNVIRKVGKQSWIDYIVGRLDWSKIKMENGRQIPPDMWRETLSHVYDTITTEGMANVTPGVRGRAALANRLVNHRFLVFKDAQAWLEYAQKFGTGTAYDVMVNHLEGMAHDISMMEIFGPNPLATIEWMKGTVRQRAAQISSAKGDPKGAIINAARHSTTEMDALYDNATGANNALSGSVIGNTFAGIRNLLTSAFLGSAALLAVPGDMFTAALVRRFNGVRGGQFLKQYVKLLNPLEEADRRIAVQSGMVAEAATSMAYAQARYFNDVYGPKLTRYLSNAVMNLSMLSPHTQAARWAFGMEFMGHLAREAGNEFDKLPNLLRNTLKRNGITADDWEVMRKTPQYDNKGAKFLRPDDVMRRADLGELRAKDVADKFMDMINEEKQAAIPLASMRARTFFTDRTRAGTFIGEMARSIGMFKNYPVTIMNIHGRRMMMQQALGGRLAYGVAFGAGMTLTGALGLQMRQIAQGKDPISMTDPETALKFWGSAALAGGGLGIWGDFLFRDVSHYDFSPAETLLGAQVGFLKDTWQLIGGNVVKAINGDKVNLGPDILRYLRTYLPGGNIWYARLALQRMIFDQLANEVDPAIERKRRKMEKDMYKDFKQKYWWKPGTVEPQRAPGEGR